MIRDGRWPEKPGELEPAEAVWRAHHGNLHALIAQSSDTSRPFSFDRGLPFEIEAELAKEIDRHGEIIDDDSYVVCLSAMCPIYKVAFVLATNRGANLANTEADLLDVQMSCQRAVLRSSSRQREAGFAGELSL